ncbi:MAG: hypothetical protein AAB447_02570 [Patescibacteria group bacterium]
MSNNATWYQSTHTLRIIGDKDPSLEHIKHLHDGLLADLVEAVMNGALPDREALRKVYGLPPLKLMIVIDYGKTLEQVLEAGKYDWVNSDVTPDRFPIKGTGVVEREAKIVHFGKDMSSEQVEAELEKKSLRPGTHEELLAFGSTYPEMQRKFPIVALGSSAVVYGGRCVVYLIRVDSERRVGLGRWGGGWGGGCRFLAFAK